MPELAEVDHARRLWDVGLNQPIRSVDVIARPTRVLRGVDRAALTDRLPGHRLLGSEAKGKQMLFRFGGSLWLGLHLGMSGRLRVEPPDHEPGRHDVLVLHQAHRSLVFHDPRHFGRVLVHEGPDEPAWWARLPPSVLSDDFSAEALSAFLTRRRRSPLKAVLLMQERFPGIGNWMADEILWRARLHPSTPAGSLDDAALASLWRATRRVARLSLDTIDDGWGYPSTWLFPHRWEPGGHCPRCRAALDRATVGGRTTCWCPRCQPE